MRSLPLIAIVGRPNVGKSTLFNRLIGQRRSIVTDEPGITRDRIYGTVSWHGRSFEIVDTGGIVPGEESEIPRAFSSRPKSPLRTLRSFFFVLDGRTGITAPDQELARILRKPHKPLFLVINKIDSGKQATDVADFYRLGSTTPFPFPPNTAAASPNYSTKLQFQIPAPEPRLKRTSRGKSASRSSGGRTSASPLCSIARGTGARNGFADRRYHSRRGRQRCPNEDLTIRFVDTAGIRAKGQNGAESRKAQRGHGAATFGAQRCRDPGHRRHAGCDGAGRPHRRLRARGWSFGDHRGQQVGHRGEKLIEITADFERADPEKS